MALSVGTTAPDFTVTTLGANGPELFKLSEHIGQSNILLLFVPMAFTGVCTKEFCEISNGINEYTALNAKPSPSTRMIWSSWTSSPTRQQTCIRWSRQARACRK